MFPVVAINNFNEQTTWQQWGHFVRFLSNRPSIPRIILPEFPSPLPAPLRTPSPRPPIPFTSLPLGPQTAEVRLPGQGPA